MSYLLDINVCIRILNNTSTAVSRQLAAQQAESMYLCTVVEMELYYGAYHSTHQEKNIAILERFFNQLTILPLNRQSARIAGKIRSQLARQGTPIGPYDLQIAAIR